jgi:hypothetical protein
MINKKSLLLFRVLFVLMLISSPRPAGAQDFSYKHYTVKDGLVSSTIYNAVHDQNGFIWFASDQGVSR